MQRPGQSQGQHRAGRLVGVRREQVGHHPAGDVVVRSTLRAAPRSAGCRTRVHCAACRRSRCSSRSLIDRSACERSGSRRSMPWVSQRSSSACGAVHPLPGCLVRRHRQQRQEPHRLVVLDHQVRDVAARLADQHRAEAAAVPQRLAEVEARARCEHQALRPSGWPRSPRGCGRRRRAAPAPTAAARPADRRHRPPGSSGRSSAPATSPRWRTASARRCPVRSAAPRCGSAPRKLTEARPLSCPRTPTRCSSTSSIRSASLTASNLGDRGLPRRGALVGFERREVHPLG